MIEPAFIGYGISRSGMVYIKACAECEGYGDLCEWAANKGSVVKTMRCTKHYQENYDFPLDENTSDRCISSVARN
jgi:hypothetical protein